MTPLLPALDVLAMRCLTAPSARAALRGWHEDVDDQIRPHLRRVSRRIALGASIEEALEPLHPVVGDDCVVLASVLSCASARGSALAVEIRGIASTIEQRAEMCHQVRGAATGARTSTRMLAVLALVFIVLLPGWRNASGLAIAGAGLVAMGLSMAGLRWIRALTPRPAAHDHSVAALADSLAGALEAGLGIDHSLGNASGLMIGADLARVRRRRRLGAPWSQAFGTAGDADLIRLGRLVETAARRGVPLAPHLRAFASQLRYEARRELELRAKKAPVMLVLPLTLCFLPAFAIVVLVPLLGGLSG